MEQLGIDIVLECTGVFTRREDLAKHIQAGAKNVILSAPTKSNDIVTVVHGVNRPDGTANIIACASCTTNCITPVVEIMGRRIGVKKAIMTTVHAYTASQALVDGPDKHLRRGRAGAANFVPTSTGAAIATTRALPQFEGLFDGVAVRGPVPVGSLADIVFLTTRPTTVDEVNQIFKEEADGERYRGILGVTEDPIVSSDVIKDPRASIVDLEHDPGCGWRPGQGDELVRQRMGLYLPDGAGSGTDSQNGGTMMNATILRTCRARSSWLCVEPGFHVRAASKGVSRPLTPMPDEWPAAQMKEI